jgi:hypothetical protein
MKRPFFILLFCLFVFAADASAQESSGGKIFWRGNVDDRVHVVIKGDMVETKTVAGKASAPAQFSFTAPLPARAVTFGVTKREGRSNNVKVLQQPSADNDFTAIVEIQDEKGGANIYLLEIFWK